MIKPTSDLALTAPNRVQASCPFQLLQPPPLLRRTIPPGLNQRNPVRSTRLAVQSTFTRLVPDLIRTIFLLINPPPLIIIPVWSPLNHRTIDFGLSTRAVQSLPRREIDDVPRSIGVLGQQPALVQTTVAAPLYYGVAVPVFPRAVDGHARLLVGDDVDSANVVRLLWRRELHPCHRAHEFVRREGVVPWSGLVPAVPRDAKVTASVLHNRSGVLLHP